MKHDVGIEEKSSCSVKLKHEDNDEIEQTKHDSNDDYVKSGDIDMPEMDVQVLDKNVYLQGKLVALSLESGTNIAGYGTIVKVDSPHELPENCMKVSIDEAVDEHAPLPIPTDECQSIGDAVGSHVIWPAHLLKVREDKPNRKNKQERSKPALFLSTIPKTLRMVYCYCKASLQGKGNIMINLDPGVFGNERTLYVHIEDVEPFCQLKPITYTCIGVYIWNLYNRMKMLDKVDKFRFVDPLNIGHIPSTKNDKKSIKERMEQRSRELARKFVGTLTNQIVLAPCNVGGHWILTVIDPHKEEVGLLDPFDNGVIDGVWKQVVDLALKKFNVNKKKEMMTPSWTMIKAPKQPDNYQCGYYVMRYMREIIESDTFETIASLQLLFQNKKYSDVDIDEVRTEWAECVQESVYE